VSATPGEPVRHARYDMGSAWWDGMIANVLAGAALVVSVLSLVVSIAAHRAGGPRIVLATTKLSNMADEWWLEVRVANSGRSEVDLDGAWAGWLGSTITNLPARLAAGSSKALVFRGELPPTQYLGNALTIQIGLGSGQTILKRLKLDEIEIAMAGRHPEPEANREVTMPIEEV
jgi:hypothetical protein